MKQKHCNSIKHGLNQAMKARDKEIQRIVIRVPTIK